MRFTSTVGRRLTALASAGAIAATLGVAFIASPAQATSLGTLTITPTTGIETTGLNAVLSAPCPDGSTGIVGYLSGPGIPDANSGVIQSNRSVSQSFQVGLTLKDVFASNSIAQPSGTYTIRMACIGADSFTEVGDFSQNLAVTPRVGVTNGANYTTLSSATSTTTAISTGTPDPVTAGTATSLIGTVTPSNAVGSIQFKNGANNIGAPIAVSGGTATLDSTVLPAGSNNLTAVFIPTDPNAFGGSTSAATSYEVVGPATITGTAKVGATVTCSAAANTSATRTYVWTVGGVASAVTVGSLKAPATWALKSVTCAAKTTKNAVTLTQTSPARTFARGTFVATRAPKVLGIAKVGKLLTCSHGTWSPTPSKYKYQWFRGTRALTGKYYSTYRTTSADKGKYVTCRVTVLKTGYTNGVKKAAPRKIS